MGKIRHIKTDKAPTPGFYSQGVLVPKGFATLYLSGQTGNVPGVPDEPVIEGGVSAQTTQTLENFLAVVREAGGDVSSIVNLRVFLKDSPTSEGKKASRLAMGEAYKAFFEKHGVLRSKVPARIMLWVSEIPFEAPTENTLVEIDGVAAISEHFDRDE